MPQYERAAPGGSAAEQGLRKSPEAIHGIGMHPVLLYETFGEILHRHGREIAPAVEQTETPRLHIHFPQYAGAAIERKLQKLAPLKQPVFALARAGNVPHQGQHHAFAAGSGHAHHSRPAPAPFSLRVKAVLVFHHPASGQAFPQTPFVLGHVVGMNAGQQQKIARQRHRPGFEIQHAQQRGARIHHGNGVLHFQKGHAFFHVIQNGAHLHRHLRRKIRLAPHRDRIVAAADVVPVATFGLRLVERGVGPFVEFFEGPRFARGYVHAHARTHMQRGIHAYGKLKRLADAPRLFPRRVFRDGPRKQSEELVAPEPPHDVRGAETPRKSLCRKPDHLIAGLMAKRIVHLLEVIEIYDEKRARISRMHVPQTLLDVVRSGFAIQEPGKHIPRCALRQNLQLPPVLKVG